MNVNKIQLLISALFVSFTLAACGGGGSDSGPIATGPVPTDY